MTKMQSFLLFSFLLFNFAFSERGSKDLIDKIPGISFEPNFKTYSGYLYANSEKTWKMHYMLTTSRSNKTTDPLVFWFNGGPGCSSLTGAFQEMGPMYADVGGKSLFENIYSWNTVANLVYLESPIGVGFSYDTKNVKTYNASDDLTALQNFNAIYDFFTDSHPEYKDRDFYLAGESYAGIYIPMLAEKISSSLSTFPNTKFRGMLIGNGYMHEDLNFNTQVLWAYYHGQVGEDEWTELKKCCKRPTDNADPDECDWTHIPKSRENFNYVFDLSPCGKILNNIMNTDDSIDPYNFYQDCYETDVSKFRSQLQLSDEARKNPGSYFNRQSTDPSQGYACYNEQTALAYFNRSDFATAFHIDKAFYDAGGVFYDCNDELGKVYKTQHSDMTSQFNNILNSLKNFKVLILNGDVDTVCNFLGDARFIKRLAISRNMQPADRGPWFYRKHVSGFTQRYIDSSNATVDVLTVKGSGHMVPMDRPGPALQMFSRFLDGTDYGKVDDKDIGVPDTLPYVKNPDSGANDGKLSVLMLLISAFIGFNF